MRPSSPFWETCQPHIGEGQENGASAIIPAMGHNLKKLREQREWTLDEAAEAFGMSRGGYIKLERSERGLKTTRIAQAAQVYGVPEHEVYAEPRRVPVVGYVAAGEAVFDAPLGGEEDTIEAPLGSPPETVAVRIRGDSLGPGFDRWYALYADRRDPITEDMVGSLCVVGTDDGRSLVKWVRSGRSGFTLVSGTGNIEEGVGITWAARVLHLTPG
jgi:repressor LexA